MDKPKPRSLILAFQDCFFADPALEKAPISELTWQTWFQQWSQTMAVEMPIAETWEVGLRLSGDREIQNLNASYRQKDYPTDVLAFAALEEADFPNIAELETEPLYLGDIIISVETASRQARSQGHSLQIELAWLASHGFLHLLGWDHPDEENLLKMLAQQRVLLQIVGLVNGDR
ncbi:rRNA maturation RNase YbeY [Spirulina sp. 06S082]|uniref:rRNA maturation RNase YbeY n=1 Tax=Spirulina sp. 06S082 TaxID=3110248 RepID=UPI002B1FEBDB|nr:rRNA maturation RNase YbeY [Spirulina sp. 06S082]MEA5468269.1 rRNA maturation RNase YbeY [Spirulina sp. 06S082]